MADTATQVPANSESTEATGRVVNTTPGKLVDGIPETTRSGFWATEYQWFVDNPHVPGDPSKVNTKLYENRSQTTASYLRAEYGLDAHNRNTKDGKADLYVRYIPEKAEEIKAGASSKSSKAKNKGRTEGNSAKAGSSAKSGS